MNPGLATHQEVLHYRTVSSAPTHWNSKSKFNPHILIQTPSPLKCKSIMKKKIVLALGSLRQACDGLVFQLGLQ